MCFIQIELSESEHDQVFYIEYGLGIVALFVAGGLLCMESWITGLCSKKSQLRVYALVLVIVQYLTVFSQTIILAFNITYKYQG